MSEELRDKISGAIAGNLPISEPDECDVDDLPDGGVMMGWVLAVEWLGVDGERWLSTTSSDATGNKLPKWQIKGYAQELLDWDK